MTGTYGPFVLPSVRRDAIPWDDALAAVIGYARGTRSLTLSRSGPLDRQVVEVPAFAYCAYDCVPPSPEDQFSWLDVLIVDSLNGKLRHDVITALKHAGDRAWPHVARAVELADGRTFWELPTEEVGRDPADDSAGGALLRAWRECHRTGAVKTALTHKLLHHKRPDLFPMVDNRTWFRLATQPDFAAGGSWGVIHAELTANADQFAALETTFAELVNGAVDVPLQRLRLHDILLWLVATRNWEHAVAQGLGTAEWQRWQERSRGR
jgi:hypothetical protein